MPPTYDVTTTQGQVRLLISDIGGQSGSAFVFQDNEVQAFLDLMDGSILRAAACALRTMAANEILTQKRITFLELRTDGPAESKELLALAESLEAKADDADDDFEVVSMVVDQFSRRYARGISSL